MTDKVEQLFMFPLAIWIIWKKFCPLKKKKLGCLFLLMFRNSLCILDMIVLLVIPISNISRAMPCLFTLLLAYFEQKVLIFIKSHISIFFLCSWYFLCSVQKTLSIPRLWRYSSIHYLVETLLFYLSYLGLWFIRNWLLCVGEVGVNVHFFPHTDLQLLSNTNPKNHALSSVLQ